MTGSPAIDRTPIKLTIDEKDDDRRLDRLLVELCPDQSRSRISKAVKAGMASLDGLPAKPSALVKTGQSLVFRPLPPVMAEPEPAKVTEVDIIYQDDDILVINKPAGLIVHPIQGRSAQTLVDALLSMAPEMSKVGSPDRPGLVQRLDKDTTGVMVTARTKAAHDFLTKAFQDRTVDKLYLAFVKGEIPDSGRIDTPIGRHPTLRHRMRTGPTSGRSASSLFKVIRRFPKTGLALVAVTLLTGRTHQARVHLSSICAPVLADAVYGRNKASLVKRHPGLAPLIKRQFLHARRLTIPRPSGERQTFYAPWPQDFRDLLAELIRLENISH
jgi:23S rRNA pseudouridine1911/1915/1917 synthase